MLGYVASLKIGAGGVLGPDVSRLAGKIEILVAELGLGALTWKW